MLSVTDSGDQQSADGKNGSFSVAISGSSYCASALTGTTD